MKIALSALGLAAGLVATPAHADTQEHARDITGQASVRLHQFTPAAAGVIEEMTSAVSKRTNIADWHEAFMKTPTFGKGGPGFVKFETPMMKRHKRHHSDVETIFNLHKPA